MPDGKEFQGKFSALIQKARESENQMTSEPEQQFTESPSNQRVRQPDDWSTRKPDNLSHTRFDNQTTRQPESLPEKEVNLCVKVPESLRRHWAAEAKREGITMTEVMVEALTQRFGRPENQRTR